MECACIDMDCGEGDPTIILSSKVVKARKNHNCSEGPHKIQKGEMYLKEVYVCDGQIYTNKTCPDCLSIRKTLFCGGFYFGCLWDELRTYIDEAGTDVCFGEKVAELTEGAREKVLKLMDELKNEKD